MFRVSMVDRDQVGALMAYVKKNAATKTVGLMAETTGYGQGGLKDMQEIADLQGIKIAATERFAVGVIGRVRDARNGLFQIHGVTLC